MTAPTVYAPYAAVIVLVMGLVASSLVPRASSGVADFTGLAAPDQGPIKV